MLEFLILLPLIMVTILSVTFQVSVDELWNARRGNFFSYDTSGNRYNSLHEKEPSSCRCECPLNQKAEGCKKLGKQFDPITEKCVCPSHITQTCSMGDYFHPELCRCIPVDLSTQNKKRRPLV